MYKMAGRCVLKYVQSRSYAPQIHLKSASIAMSAFQRQHKTATIIKVTPMPKAHYSGRHALFRQFIENSVDKKLALQYKCYLTTVVNYNKLGLSNSNSIYTSRAYHLLPVAQKLDQMDELNTVDCTCNLNSIFETLMTQYDCSEKTRSCTLCGHESKKKKPVTPIPNLSIVRSKYQTLEDQLSIYFSQENIYTCTECKKKGLTCYNIVGSYLWIDVEDVYKSRTLSKTETSKTEEIYSNLAELPINLTITKQKFILCGVVECRPGHFVAHYYNNQYEYWEEKNDMNECAIRYYKNFPNMKINSILYVKWESHDE